MFRGFNHEIFYSCRVTADGQFELRAFAANRLTPLLLAPASPPDRSVVAYEILRHWFGVTGRGSARDAQLLREPFAEEVLAKFDMRGDWDISSEQIAAWYEAPARQMPEALAGAGASAESLAAQVAQRAAPPTQPLNVPIRGRTVYRPASPSKETPMPEDIETASADVPAAASAEAETSPAPPASAETTTSTEAAEPAPSPTIGRIVHFHVAGTKNGEPYAAIVTHVWNDRKVNLHVLDDGTFPLGAHECIRVSVPYGTGPNCWSWPQRS